MRKPLRPTDVPAVAFVDSGAWLALISRSDGRHAAAHAAFARATHARRPLATTTLVVAEVHRLLLYRAGIAPARAFLSRLTESGLLRLEHPGTDDHRAAFAWLDRLSDHASPTPTRSASPS